MEMSLLYIGVDIGTQGAKAVVYDPRTKEVVARGGATYGLVTDPKRPGLAEQDPDVWIQGGKEAIKEAVASVSDRKRIACIGVSGQQHGLVVLDENKRVLRRAKLWCDSESNAEAKELSSTYGLEIGPSFTASKVLWLKRNEPETWAKCKHVLLPHDYFNYWLTGRLVAEASDASGTGYYDIVERCWSKSKMAAVDPNLCDYVPPLIGPNDIVGNLLSEVADILGLHQGVTVSPGGGDNAMSALAVGAVSDGTAVISLGTSGTLFGCSSRPVFDKEGIICAFCDATGKYLPLICTLNCTEVPQDVRKGTELGLDEITAAAASHPAGCEGVNYIPYLRGERTPNWPHASGALVGLRQGMLGNPGLLYRAALEGVTYSLLAGVNQMKSYGVSNLENIRLVGGGAKNPLWVEIIASSFGVPVSLPEETETAALGAALQAAAVQSKAKDIGDFVSEHAAFKSVVQPKREDAALYQAAFERHDSLSKAIFG